MPRYEDIYARAGEKALQVAASPKSWKAFLASAGYTYRNLFANQLLIYDQRPDATAVGSMEFWNKNGRRVQLGGKGIAILGEDAKATRGKITYLFDVSDTYAGAKGRSLAAWQVNDQNRTAAMRTYLAAENADVMETTAAFVTKIISQAKEITDARMDELLPAMKAALEESNMVWADDAEQRETVYNLAVQSTAYMACRRFGLPTDGLETSSFENIAEFDSVDAALFMGRAVQQVSNEILSRLGRAVRSIDSVARTQAAVHNRGEAKEITKETTPSQKEAENNDVSIHERQRLSDPQPEHEPAAQGFGQIRQNGSAASATEQAVPVRENALTGNAVPEPTENGGTDAGANRPDGGTVASGAESNLPRPQDRPVGLDAVDEWPENAGGGAGDADAVRTVNEDTDPIAERDVKSPSAFSMPENNQLTFLQEEQPADAPRGVELAESVAAELGLASPERQSEAIKAATFKQNWHEPKQDKTGEIITNEEFAAYLLRCGSGFAEGRFRIYRKCMTEPSDTEFAKFLKNEFGIGGCSWSFLDGRSGSVEYDGKGFSLKHGWYSEPDCAVRTFTWSEMAKRIRFYVNAQRYLTQAELAQYPDWLEQQQKNEAEQAAERVRRDAERAERQNEPVLQRPYAVGDVVYLEDDHAFTIEEIGLLDIQLQDNEIPLISRAINKNAFAVLLAQNPRNAHLKPPEEVKTEPQIVTGSEVVATYPAIGNGLPYDIVVETLHTPEREASAAATIAQEKLPESGESSAFVDQVMADAASLAASDPPYQYEPINYTAPYHSPAMGGPKERFAANMEAIRTLKAIEQRMEHSGNPATESEQSVLAKYVGWGGLADAFDPNKGSWSEEYVQLKNTLTEPEYNAARESTLTAFFTPNEAIHPIYRALERMGVTGGNILEPSMGVGAFFGAKPTNFDQSNAKLYGVELDDLTGRIAKQLYQKAHIQIAGFEKANLPDNFFDCVVGNVPFGDFSVSDRQYDKIHFRIHDYFIAKSIDKLRVGGIMAVITTSGTMDKKSEEVRKYIAARCELIGAVRLPDTTFKANAGTEATADILFLQKRDRIVERDEPWLHLSETTDGIPINGYFAEHPEMICGQMEMVSGPYGMRPTCKADTTDTLENQLDAAMRNLNATLTKVEIELEEGETPNEDKTIPADPTVRNFSYTLFEGKIYYRENSVMQRVDPGATADKRIRKLIALRDTTRDLIEAQLQDMPDAEIERLQALLNRQYDAFHNQFGLINSRGCAQNFQDDSSYFLLCSLEDLDEEGNYRGKTDLFTKRTIRAARVADHVDTATEALAVSIGEKAKVDLPYMAQLTGKSEETLVEELTGVIFCDPLEKQMDGAPHYLAADEYLSGDVRHKLATARIAAESNPAFAINVQALEQVQPKDLEASEIAVRLGTTWITPEIIKQFADELVDAPYQTRRFVKVNYVPYTGTWNITNKSYTGGNIKATVTYGTPRANFYNILEESLNLRAIRIFDKVQELDGTEKRVLNAKATQEAQEKQRQIEEAFKDWIFKDQTRRQQLVKYYNEHFNSVRPREYDGSHIQFHGMNPEITLRPHQRNAIAHILYGHNTLLAHVVGSGKTYEMVAAAMEKKRLGLCAKTLICVPNHLTEQLASEALLLYPNANILVAKRADFEKSRRKRFCAKIATGNYDIIVIGHSQFERIPLSQERQADYLQRQIDEIMTQVTTLKQERAENFTIKQMERMKKQLQKKLDKLNDTARKDDVVTFEELGVDSLMVDEAHTFKNLMCISKMRNVAGISQTESQKASDLLMKCMYLDEITGGRGIAFATGTPVSNSMTELYTMMRYLQHHTLERNGLEVFDSWASTFGETVTAIELSPEGTGYRTKTRFARFYNLPELMSMFKEAADIQTADMLKLPVPELEGGKPINVQLKPSDIQREMVAELGKRADVVRSGSVDPTVDNMLKITNDGRKLALDQRLIDPTLPDDPNSKVNACVENVYTVWARTQEKRSAQLVFCDLSTPKPGTFNVYYDVRDKLIARGVPAEEIQFIHDANTEARKAELFGKVRSGTVRVLLGSTAKMGAGTNVQKKLVALHHLDVPWRPADIEQREGRMIRQGNENSVVTIFRYVTEGTFDAYSWQLIENKQRFISQIMTSKSPCRSCDDMDEAALSYAEVKALAAGNPAIKQKMDLDIQVSRLKTLKAAYTTQHYRLEDAITIGFPAEIQKLNGLIVNAEKDTALLKENTHMDTENKEIFSMTLMDTAYTKKEDAGKSLLGLLGSAMSAEAPVEIGSYKGFKLQISYYPMSKEFHAQLVGAGSHDTQLGADVLGNITRINNVLNAIPESVTAYQEKLVQMKKQKHNAEEELQQPFLQEAELAEKSKRLAELDALLNTSGKDDAQLLDTTPDEPDAPRRERSAEHGER